MGCNDFSLPAVGERYDNEDGSSRQLEIAECKPGDLVELVRQPNNPHDHMAVAIFTSSGTCVGYLGRVKAQWIGSKMDRGTPVSAIVERIRGIGLDGSELGLILRLNMDGEEPELPEATKRKPKAKVASSYDEWAGA